MTLIRKSIELSRVISSCVCRGDLRTLLYRISQLVPRWLFKFAAGTVMVASSPTILTKDRPRYIFGEANRGDVAELSQLTGTAVQDLHHRFQIGDRAFVMRDSQRNNKIVTVQWMHRGPVFIRGYALELRLAPDAVYAYGALSAEEVRLLGLFNSSYSKVVSILQTEGTKQIFALVEFWNALSLNYHLRLNFKSYMRVTLVSVFGFKVLILTQVETNRRSVKFILWRPKNVPYI